MVAKTTYRICPLLVFALLPACSAPTGPSDEQVSRDVTSFLREKCEPLGTSMSVQPVSITAVRVASRRVSEDQAEVIAVAEGKLDENSAYRGYVFSDYCPAGVQHRSELAVAYARRDGNWVFNGNVRLAGDTHTSLNTASSQSVKR